MLIVEILYIRFAALYVCVYARLYKNIIKLYFNININWYFEYQQSVTNVSACLNERILLSGSLWIRLQNLSI